MEDNRNLRDLAEEVILVQDACNLSGVVNSWSRSIAQLRVLMPTLGTAELNRHPINKLWASKVQSLTGREDLSPEGIEEFSKAYEWCKDITNRE